MSGNSVPDGAEGSDIDLAEDAEELADWCYPPDGDDLAAEAEFRLTGKAWLDMRPDESKEEHVERLQRFVRVRIAAMLAQKAT